MLLKSSKPIIISPKICNWFTGIEYDHRNLPTRFDMEEGGSLTAAYNADGQRILKESSGGAWQFYVMDGPQTLAVIDQNGLSHMNLLGNETFGRWEPGGARRYYVKDHLGSTRAVVDDSGTLLETFDYYPFGLLMPQRTTAGANTIEKFTGKERDTEAGVNLDYFGARYYDGAIGRWHNVDPILGELRPDSLLKMRSGILLSHTPYNYTFNNPLRYLDPDGRCPEPTDKDGTICVSLFIQSESVLGLKGDNRGFSSSSDPLKSRVFLHIDVENQSFNATPNPTCTTGGDCADPLPSNKIDVAFGKEGSFTVLIDAKNSILPGPAINGTFTFTPDGKGGFKNSGDRDAFPSAEAYFWRNGQPSTLFKRPEKTPFHLLPFMPNDRWRR